MGLGDKIKSFAKSYIKTILKGLAFKIIILSAIIVLILALLWYAIGHGTISTVSNVIRSGSLNTNVTIDENNRNYKIDEALVERVNQALKNMAINKSSIELSDDLLLKFYEAEITTSFPDLRKREKIGTKVSNGEIQGCIQFVRKYEDGTENGVEQLLEFISFKEFQQKLAYFGYELKDENGYSPTVYKEDIYTTKSQVEEKYNELRQYFTLDSENNLVIATMTSTEIKTTYNNWAYEEGENDDYSYTYNVNVETINYQAQVQKYSMPIEYLLSMLMVSENGKFCEAIADLAKESEIVIELHDETTTTETKDKYDYKSYFYLKRDIEYEYTGWGPTGTFMNGQEVYGDIQITDNKTVTGLYTKYRHMDIDKDNDSYSTTITTSKNNQIQLCVTEVKTWILDAIVKFEKNNDINVDPITIVGDEPENKDDEFVSPSNLESYEDYIEKVKDDETIDDPHNLMVKLNNYENMRNR